MLSEKANGSARVKMGATDVIASVKVFRIDALDASCNSPRNLTTSIFNVYCSFGKIMERSYCLFGFVHLISLLIAG